MCWIVTRDGARQRTISGRLFESHMHFQSRAFLLVLSAAGALNAAPGKMVTARQVITLIQQHSGVSWEGPTVDTFKAGDPDTPVTGIATTMMATFDVLKRAAARGDNLIITHEPTFFNHA